MNKSYLKWAGSKSRILQEVLDTFPANIGCYAEPFLGSGTVALNVTAESKLLNDLNGDVILCHETVHKYPEQLLNQLKRLYQLGRESYYHIRTAFNTADLTAIQKSAAFIYMNKHGYNGLCRYSKNGFNIPVGKSKTIHFPDTEINAFKGNLGSNIEFLSTDFEEFCSMIPNKATVYMDPPYVPKSASNSNINYTGESFTWIAHTRLRDCILRLQARGCHVVVSNHDMPVTRQLYKDADEIRSVKAFRSVSSKNNRGDVDELLAIYLPKEKI